MNDDLISREALKIIIDQEQIINPKLSVYDVSKIIDNAPTVFNCNACKNMGNERECVDCHDYSNYVHYDERPQSEIIKAYTKGFDTGVETVKNERPQGEWDKWVISEIRCPNCLEYFQTDCYSTEELKKCPNCGADMRGGSE